MSHRKEDSMVNLDEAADFVSSLCEFGDFDLSARWLRSNSVNRHQSSSTIVTLARRGRQAMRPYTISQLMLIGKFKSPGQIEDSKTGQFVFWFANEQFL